MKKKIRQQEFGFVYWGGKRRGAGRKPMGERAGVSHAKRPRLPARFPVLVTMKLCEGLQTLRAKEVHALIRSAIAAGRREDFRVVEYSLQETHIHALVEATDERSLSRAINGLATRIARGLNRLWQRVGRVFAERYHALQLTTPRAVRNALIYVLHNARKHGAWRGSAPDVYSSAASFEGWKGHEKAAESRSGLLERARTWLLSVGWRKHGLIDPLEVPVGAEVWMCLPLGGPGPASRSRAQAGPRRARDMRPTEESEDDDDESEQSPAAPGTHSSFSCSAYSASVPRPTSARHLSTCSGSSSV